MTTPAQVPEAPTAPAPPRPRALYVWLMRGGCYACIACLAAFAWWAPDSIFLDAIAAIGFLLLALLKPRERRLQAALEVGALAFAVALCGVLIPAFAGLAMERIAWLLLSAATISTLVVCVGAFLALRSVPKQDWVAQRPAPPPPIDSTNVHPGLGWLARAIALLALASPFVAATYARQEAFYFFAGLLVLPYLVFLVNPVRRPWLAWGQALAVINAVLFVLPLVFSVMAVFEQAHVPRSDRAWTAFIAVYFLCQVALFFVVRRSYTGRVGFGKEAVRGVLYYLCMLIFMAATLPSMVYSRRGANESTSAASVRTINTVAYTYQQQYPNVGYPPSLKVLGACTDPPTKDAGCFLDNNLGCPAPACIKSGYRFSYKPVMKDGVVVHYSVVARPIEYDETGTRSFYTDDTAVIRATTDDRDANANDPPL